MQRFPLVIPLVAVAALAFAACGGDDTTGTPVTDPASPPTAPPTTAAPAVDLDGREFLSVSVEGYDLVDDTVIRLSFDNGSLTANAGCNTLTGEYTVTDGRLGVQQLAGTEMACDTELMTQDRWLTDILALEPIVTLDGDTLTMRGAGGATLEFVDREVAEPDRPITETRWVLDGIRDGDAVSSVPDGVTATITFHDDDTAVVEAGCNGGSAGVEITDDTIVFGPLALTRMMCEPAAMEVESAMTALLHGEVTYSIDGDRLTLDSPDTGSAAGDTGDDTGDEPVEMGGTGLMFVADDATETT